MRRTFLRLLIALFLSLSSWSATLSYYRATDPGETKKDEKLPVAFVRDVDGVHYLRGQNSVLWRPAQEGDPIYPGDTAKTSDQGSLHLQIANSSRSVELEASTTLLVTNSGNVIVLDLVDGFATVKGKELLPAVQTVTAEGPKTIDDDTVVLSKESDKPMRMSRKSSVVSESNLPFTWIAPSGDFESDLNPDDSKPISFTWKTAEPTAPYKMSIEWGSSRKSFDHRKIVDASLEKAEQILPIGKHFWRWTVLQDEKPIWSSPSARVSVRGLFSTPITQPLNGSVSRLKEIGEAVQFRWSSDKRFSGYRAEIATDEKLSNRILLKELTGTDSEFSQALPKPGVYYWRLASYDVEKKQWLNSKIHSFRVALKIQERIPLRWLTKANETLRYLTLKPTVKLAWAAEKKGIAKHFKIMVAPASQAFTDGFNETISASERDVPLPGPGRYRAQVEALNDELEIIGQLAPIEFEVEPVPPPRFPATAYDPTQNLQANGKGQFVFEWTPVADAREYVVELKSSFGEAQVFRTKQPKYEFNRLLPGRYAVTLRTVDVHGRSSETSRAYSLLVADKSSIKAIRLKKLEIK